MSDLIKLNIFHVDKRNGGKSASMWNIVYKNFSNY